MSLHRTDNIKATSKGISMEVPVGVHSLGCAKPLEEFTDQILRGMAKESL